MLGGVGGVGVGGVGGVFSVEASELVVGEAEEGGGFALVVAGLGEGLLEVVVFEGAEGGVEVDGEGGKLLVAGCWWGWEGFVLMVSVVVWGWG